MAGMMKIPLLLLTGVYATLTTGYTSVEEIPSKMILLDVNKTNSFGETKIILNCSSSGTTLFEHSAEFIVNNKTISNIRLYKGRCFMTENALVCVSSKCGCYADEYSSWYFIVINETDTTKEFVCRIYESDNSGTIVYSLQGIWNQDGSKSRTRSLLFSAYQPKGKNYLKTLAVVSPLFLTVVALYIFQCRTKEIPIITINDKTELLLQTVYHPCTSTNGKLSHRIADSKQISSEIKVD